MTYDLFLYYFRTAQQMDFLALVPMQKDFVLSWTSRLERPSSSYFCLHVCCWLRIHLWYVTHQFYCTIFQKYSRISPIWQQQGFTNSGYEICWIIEYVFQKLTCSCFVILSVKIAACRVCWSCFLIYQPQLNK